MFLHIEGMVVLDRMARQQETIILTMVLQSVRAQALVELAEIILILLRIEKLRHIPQLDLKDQIRIDIVIHLAQLSKPHQNRP
jgi:hypothetical protein